jgi:GNAT superfamily N-acetyltransferase
MSPTSAYAERLIAAITRTTPADREELLEFRARMYGPQSAFADPRWVRWLYDEAPLAADRGPALWVFRDAGRIGAQQGAIRTRVRVGHNAVELSWALDLMVSPELRARGVGALLPKRVLEECSATAGTEVSDAAQKAFGRAGWAHLGTLPQWVRPVAAEEFMRARAPDLPAGLLRLPFAAAERTVAVYARLGARGRQLSPPVRFDQRADEVWERSAPSWPVIGRRDYEWVRWRWEGCPRRDGATVHWLERGSETVGWVVLRVGEHRGVRAGFIVDLLAPSHELSALFALAVERLRHEQVVAVYCLFNAPGAQQALARSGFLRRDSGFAMMAFAGNLPAESARLLTDPTQWFITAGDSDLDRPRDHTTYA